MFNEELKYAVESGIIDLAHITKEVEMKKKESALKKHPYDIWQGKNKYWYTRLPDKLKGRCLVKKKNKEDLEDAIVAYYQSLEKNPTLNDLFYQCYEERVERKTISEATYTRYENIYKKYYGESPLGKRKIQTLSEYELSEFIISAVYDKKMKAKEFGLLRTVTTGILKCAKRQGYTDISPTLFFSDLDLGKKSFANNQNKNKKEIYTVEEIQLIKKYVAESPTVHNISAILLAKTGMRDGDDDDKIRLNQRKPSKYKGLSRFGPEKNLQRINKFMKERPTFYKKLIQMKENFRFYLRCFYCITKVVILQFNSEKQDRISS